jgi:hypothetical protein
MRTRAAILFFLSVTLIRAESLNFYLNKWQARLGLSSWTVTVTEGPDGAQWADRLGHSKWDPATKNVDISIKPDQTELEKERSVVHELLHVLFLTRGTEEEIEKVTCALVPGVDEKK